MLLIHHILSWCSAKFTVKVSKIVNMYYEHTEDIKIAESNRKHDDEFITENKTQSEKQISDNYNFTNLILMNTIYNYNFDISDSTVYTIDIYRTQSTEFVIILIRVNKV